MAIHLHCFMDSAGRVRPLSNWPGHGSRNPKVKGKASTIFLEDPSPSFVS